LHDAAFADLDLELQPYLGLHGSRSANHPEHGPCFICEGRYLVTEALSAHRAGQLRVLSVLASAGSHQPDQLPSGVKALVAEKEFLERLLGFSFHRGLLCCVQRPPEPSVETIQAAHRLVVLPRLDNVDNLGQLLRSAAAMGMDAVITGQGPGPFDRRTVRVSMGAAWKIPVLQLDDPFELLESWRDGKAGVASEIAGAALVDGALDAADWHPSARTALVLGPEDRGLDSRWLALCDRHVRIPMSRGMDSLNVAAAGAILMHQMMTHIQG